MSKEQSGKQKAGGSSTSGNRTFWQKFVGFVTDNRFHVAVGILMIAFALYMALAMVSYFFTGTADNSIVSNYGMFDLTDDQKMQITNWGGRAGAYMSEVFINDWFGLASFFILILMTIYGVWLITKKLTSLLRMTMMLFYAVIWTSTTISFFFFSFYEDFINFGGDCGKSISDWLTLNLGTLGTLLVILATLLLFLFFFHQQTIPFLINTEQKIVAWFKNAFRKSQDEILEGDDNSESATDNIAANNNNGAIIESEPVEPVEEIEDDKGLEWTIDANDENEKNEEKDDIDLKIENGEEASVASMVPAGPVIAPAVPAVVPSPSDIDDDEAARILAEAGEYDPTLDLSHYQFPTINLLKDYGNDSPAVDMSEQNANKNKIITTLQNYGIEITSIKATVGPTITLYEIVPKPGVRISKIRSLESDIMLSLAATGIRIIAPIPGKGTIGIEVPNEKKQIVSMLSMINSKTYQEAREKYALPVAIGKTITNDVFCFDLAKAPHVLVAGATGQGKSVALNAIITSLLYAKHPAYLKFVMVDPKKVEFTLYSKVERQFLAKVPDGEEPIITDVTKVVQTLNSLTKEMDTRYDLLKKAGVRNIAEYNDKFIHRKLNPDNGHKFLPYIVVVIDEFGDLIMVAGKEVELPIARIAQLARAVGIHMIIATQRPSVNVITGIIKANFPTRIACRVTSVIDSRTVLDASGAQQLIGRGDLLFSKDGETTRVQCAFVDTPEVENIVDYIGNQQGYPTAFILPEYDANAGTGSYDDPYNPGGTPTITVSNNIDPNERDPMFEEIAKMVVESQQGSASFIQRKFKIGFARAGRIVDQLEAAGIIGPYDGSKQRAVLVPDSYSLELKLHGAEKRNETGEGAD